MTIDERPVLTDVSFSIPGNGITCVLGPTDSGKTSLLYCLNRLINQTRGAKWDGDLILRSTDIGNLTDSTLRRRVGIIFPQPIVFPYMTIFENVVSGYALNKIRLGKGEKDRIVHEALEMVGLGDRLRDRLNKPPDSLDTCDRQLLCLARSLALKPDMIMLDEPTTMMTPPDARRFEGVLSSLHLPLLFSTYYPDTAARLAEHCIVLIDGKVVETGPTSRVFTVPDHKATEDFLTGRKV
jgi:phosphate transport system ATP-binding protein